MSCSSFPYEFLEFLCNGMSYLFGCFRFRDDDDFRPQINLVSQPITAIRKEPVDSLASNGVWSVLIPEAEDSYHSQCEEGKYGVVGSPFPDDELRAEAKFLKACGTLPQTPAEFRNSEKLKDSQPHNGDAEFTFRSWLSNTDYTSIENLLANPPDELQSPMKLFEEWENGSDSSSHSRESHMTGEYTDTICTSSSEVYGVGHAVKDTPAPALNPSTSCTPMVPSTQWKNKSVRFEGQNDACSTSSSSSSPKTTNQNFKPSELPFDQSVPKPSPYPTPLKLTDDMQTPGTVFPSYVYNKETGKNPRIRLQYAYSGVNHENISKLKAPIESKLSSVQCSALGEESDEQFDEENPQSQVELQANASEKEVNADDTLSSWLPPPKLSYEGRKDQSLVPISEGLHDFGRTPGERPILGVAAAHWNAENTPFSPKWWDGNGIPNTTTKYKEDQKVSWHATPFEERLEKALSEDKFVNERKQVVQTLPVEF